MDRGIALVAAGALLAACEGSLETDSMSPSGQMAREDVPDYSIQPPKVALMDIRMIDVGTGDLFVRFEQGEVAEKTIDVELEQGKHYTLKDTGEAPDEVAKDGVYSAKVSFDLKAHVARNDAYLARVQRGASVATFSGRILVAQQTYDPSVRALNYHGEPVTVDFDDVAGLQLTLFNNDVASLTSATIDPYKTLAVRDLSVVHDPVRTGVWEWDGSSCVQVGNPDGVWGFTGLMEGLANTPLTGVTVEDFVKDWFLTFDVQQLVNYDLLYSNHQGVYDLWNRWPHTWDDGIPNQFQDELDLNGSPFQLLSIMNRVDLRGAGGYGGAGGELRFVFGFVDTDTCEPLAGNVIFEYGVPIRGCAGTLDYAQDWYDLDALTLGTPAYNSALEAITVQVTAAGAAPNKINGSALNQLRSNEQTMLWGHYPTRNWDLRQFELNSSGALTLAPVTRTPAWPYELPNANGVAPIDAFINTYAASILNNTYDVALNYPNAINPFRGGHAYYGHWDLGSPFPNYTYNDLTTAGPERMQYWGTANVGNPSARQKFSLNTCNGCHAGETFEDADTLYPGPSMTGAILEEPFRHVTMRPLSNPGPADFSVFLTGTNAGCTTTSGLVPPLGTDTYSASCAPVSDPAFGHTVGQVHFNDLLRRSQDLEDFVTNGCTTNIAIESHNVAANRAPAH